MNYILYDGHQWEQLLPITYTRPVCKICVGIWTIHEKWEHWLGAHIGVETQSHLSDKFEETLPNYLGIRINGSVCPNKQLISEIQSLKKGEGLLYNGNIIAEYRTKNEKLSPDNYREINFPITQIENVWDIFLKNKQEIKLDFEQITEGRVSKKLSASNHVFQSERIFVEDSAQVECSVLNPNNGYIYIGEGVQIMEGSLIRGSLAINHNSVLKMGAKIYGATTIGPHCKVGGEVSNSVFIGYSNKAHEGFLGNSVLGEWCNLGADTNTSNLKNNYDEIKIWSIKERKFISTGQQFCGLIMGDHSKSGINAMFNTGTIVGVSSNIFGSGFPITYIPSFQWGGASGFTPYVLEKAIATASRVMKRKTLILDKTEEAILKHIHQISL